MKNEKLLGFYMLLKAVDNKAIQKRIRRGKLQFIELNASLY